MDKGRQQRVPQPPAEPPVGRIGVERGAPGESEAKRRHADGKGLVTTARGASRAKRDGRAVTRSDVATTRSAAVNEVVRSARKRCRPFSAKASSTGLPGKPRGATSTCRSAQ